MKAGVNYSGDASWGSVPSNRAAGLVARLPLSAKAEAEVRSRFQPTFGCAVEDADVCVGHDRASGSGNVIEPAVAWGNSSGTSSGPTRRKPSVPSRLVIGSGERQHSGQAVMYAATAGLKRSRQGGQQRRVMGSQLVLSGQAVPTPWADAVHHGVVGEFVIELEIHPVAPEA